MYATAVVIANPRASGIDASLAHVLSLLSDRMPLEIAEPPSNAREFARLKGKIAAAGRVLVAGGDGTIHHLLPLLLEGGKPIGVLPLGTANDFARSIGLTGDLDRACAIAAGSHTRFVDIGLINGRPFLNVASLGVAATITQLQSAERKRRFRVWSYALSLLQAIRRSKPFKAQISATGRADFKGIVLQASVGNGRFHGGGLSSGPDALIDDGLLHVYAVAARRWWQLLPVVPALLFGLHKWSTCIASFNTQHCTVRTKSLKRATVDGELLDEKAREFRFEIRRNALQVFAPAPVAPAPPLGDPAPAQRLARHRWLW